MDEKELSKYYHLKLEIQDLEDSIKEFGYGIKSPQFDKIQVGSSHINSSIQERLLELQSRLIDKRLTALEQYLKIETYIEEIEDVEIRNIARCRFLKLMNWEEIGNKLYQDRTTVSKKLRKYISHNSHK